MDVFEEIYKKKEFDDQGIDYEFDITDGVMKVMVKDPEPTLLENIGEGLERVAGTTASIGAGAFGATLGFPTDLASLFISIGKSVGAEDGKKLETFANTFETLSKENYGSQFYKGLFDNFVDDLKISDQKKEDFKAGFVGGEFLGVGNIGGQAAKKAPAVAKSIRETSEEVGEAAQKKVDENQGSMTMSSMGVGEMGNMVNKGLSKLAPKLSVKDSVVNYVQSPSLMSRDELVKSLDSDPTVVKKSVAALRNLGKVNDDGTVTIYRRIPLRKGEELKDEAVISGSHDVRAVRDAHEGLEGITTFDIFGQPKARGEEAFVKYKVPIDRIKGYLPEVGEYTRGTQARIQRAMQGRIDEKRKQGLGQFTKLKETKKIFERLVNKEKEIIADVSGIKPEKLDRAILYDPSFDDIIEGKVKTGDEYKKANPGITFDETAKIRQALAGGNTVRAGTNEPIEIDQSLAINPKTGKRFTYDEFIDYDKQKAQEYVDKIRDDFGLPKLAPNKGEVIDLKPKVDRLNFYSKAEEVTNQLKQNKGTGQQYRQQLLKAGVKPDEIEWLGLDDVLKKGKITKQELQDQINANRIELDEVELSGGGDNVADGLASRFNENETVISAEDAFGPKYLNERADKIFEEGPLDKSRTDFTRDKAMQLAKAEYDDNPVMKYVDPKTGYTITGNDDLGYSIFRSEADSSNFRNAIDYNESNPSQSRDVPYSLNEAVIRAREDMTDTGLEFQMSRELQSMGRTRFGEFTEPGGDNYREFLIKYNDPKVKFDESHFDEENVIAHFRTKDRTTSDGKKVFYIEEIQSDWGQKGRQSGFKKSEEEMVEISNKRKQAQTKLDKYIKQVQDSGEDLAGKDLDEATSLRTYLQQTSTFVGDNDRKYFKAPFITDTDKWTQLTLKRILSKAVDEGYDFVSITPGKAQMDRWRNEGVAKFYDEIVPKNAEKIVKKLDKNAIQKDKAIRFQKTFESSPPLDQNATRFSIELTPQLKEKVKKGMAMFSATPLVVGQENE